MRPDLHLGESQRVMESFPYSPFHAVRVRRVIASQVATVQVGSVTVLVPPGTFVQHCTRAARVYVIILVSSAEFLSEMPQSSSHLSTRTQ